MQACNIRRDKGAIVRGAYTHSCKMDAKSLPHYVCMYVCMCLIICTCMQFYYECPEEVCESGGEAPTLALVAILIGTLKTIHAVRKVWDHIFHTCIFLSAYAGFMF